MNMIAVALLLSLVPAPAPVAPEYVALGDSYASGLGAGNESSALSDSCRRSPHGYPELWAERSGASLVFAACAGATTADVIAQAARITPETGLVTITAGGNDAGFTDVMTTCTISQDDACARRVDEAEAFVRDELPGRLDALYRAVRERTSAEVVVLGYPRLFSDSALCVMGKPKRDALNRAVDLVAEVTAARAEAAGFTFADVRDGFDGHGACAAAPWVNGVVLVPMDRSFHPNRDGHRYGYLPALAEAVGGDEVADDEVVDGEPVGPGAVAPGVVG
ncbi:SGNH/GDSL hydrolase family protein [Saccharothrix syringae]|uniref:SGNH/GDSL hydrolase family protein n=1 Tax=Saccharothrix syringae TaxID=103733 RepID=A0A5Q0GWD5_SACSY|nr:SGNH/GDSL hydrolase family protein [Saccharothrix syringae]QFZ17662.1 SGNH/GDSL hydrolase family protein [Saccharothrix syringae]